MSNYSFQKVFYIVYDVLNIYLRTSDGRYELLFFTNIFIYKPHIKTFIHVYKLFIIIKNANYN